VKVTPDGDIQEEQGLDEYSSSGHTDFFIQQVQNIYAFREIVGVSSTYDSSIKIRTLGIGFFPYSWREPGFTQTFHSTVVPNVALDTWFKDREMQDVIRKLLGIDRYESLPLAIHSLRSKLEDVTMRVDSDLIWVVDSICQRVVDRIYD